MDDENKAARWIGWALGFLEGREIIKDNQTSRDWIREDVDIL